MNKALLTAVAACLLIGAGELCAQSVRVIPRPPALPPGTQLVGESPAPDGYAPIPQWLGQTRAPVPAKTAEYDILTVAEGLSGAFCFHFLPDGRIIVGERPGHIKLVALDGRVSEPLDGC